jgi:hypothetical protein
MGINVSLDGVSHLEIAPARVETLASPAAIPVLSVCRPWTLVRKAIAVRPGLRRHALPVRPKAPHSCASKCGF